MRKILKDSTSSLASACPGPWLTQPCPAGWPRVSSDLRADLKDPSLRGLVMRHLFLPSEPSQSPAQACLPPCKRGPKLWLRTLPPPSSLAWILRLSLTHLLSHATLSERDLSFPKPSLMCLQKRGDLGQTGKQVGARAVESQGSEFKPNFAVST